MVTQHGRLEGVGDNLESRDARVIPGTVKVDGTEFIYFSDDGVNKFRKQFKNVTEFTNPPNAKSGGVSERGCRIASPDGRLFHAIGYHGDIEGWRKDVAAGAQAFGLLVARVEAGLFVISDGNSFSLDQCRVDFY
ncbi:hypothetical protein [Burkholderia pyrrocinia]|uniref:hypothetical protein n=1 Tax=Burkholderia pyrrocinia TaxID=60550 RepID=UPI001BCB78D1|nr:hypothetical protein [Burkholderia pyrrocinia]QVN18997.1 hypothetical protein JYG32_04480 [Burkholderia pyrrocinia]